MLRLLILNPRTRELPETFDTVMERMVKRFASCLLSVVAATSYAAERTLHVARSAHELEAVSLEVGVGDVTVTGCDCREITAVVVVSGKRWQLEELELIAEVAAKTLRLALEPRKGSGKKIGEDWNVRVPKEFSVSVKAGVGDVHITGVEGHVTAKVGVGDLRVAGLASDLEVETGVGDVEIRGFWDKVGKMRLVTGVGSVTLRTPGGQLSGRGLVSESLIQEGPGTARIHVTAGVGNVTVHFRED